MRTRSPYKQISKMVDRRVAQFDPEAIILFGSHARREDSLLPHAAL